MQEGRGEGYVVVRRVEAADGAGVGGVGAGGGWWRGGELVRVDFGLAVDQVVEGGGVEPRGWDDVGAALLFEEEGEPEGEVGAVGWFEGDCGALLVMLVLVSLERREEVLSTYT